MRRSKKKVVPTWKKSLRVIKNSVLGVLIFLVVVLAYHGIRVRADVDFIPSILGHTYLNVLSGSMEPEYSTNDLVIGRKIRDTKALKVGDVITFKDGNRLVTHRISEIVEGNTFRTKGDANEFVDVDSVNGQDIVSVAKFEIPKGGFIVAKFQDFTFLALVGAILLYFIIDELIKEFKKVKMKKEAC